MNSSIDLLDKNYLNLEVPRGFRVRTALKRVSFALLGICSMIWMYCVHIFKKRQTYCTLFFIVHKNHKESLEMSDANNSIIIFQPSLNQELLNAISVMMSIYYPITSYYDPVIFIFSNVNIALVLYVLLLSQLFYKKTSKTVRSCPSIS